ncbi:MAG: DUF973 family protein [Sulfolobus sp.]
MLNPEVKAIQYLRSGSLFAIIAAILPSIAIIFLIISLFTSKSAIGGAIFIIIGIIALVLAIISVLKLRSGFSGLETVGKDVGGVTGTTLWIIGLVLLLLIIIPPIAIIGAILIIIGYILIGLAIRRVGQIYNVGNIRNGGILIAIGSIIPFAAFIGFILTYLGLGKLLNMMGMGGQPMGGTYMWTPTTPYPMQGTMPTQQLPIYQTGQGYIYNNNGTAVVQLYSTQPAQLLSARIEGTTYTTSNFNPNYLQPNTTTQVTINFGPLMLTVGQTYRIIITTLVGSQTLEIPVYVTVT